MSPGGGNRPREKPVDDSRPVGLPKIGNAERKYERILEELRAAIEDGRLAVGSLHSIKKLADEFGTSRVPVHEAAVRLLKFSLVELPERHGLYVVGTSGHDVEDIFQIRLWLEPPAAKLATQNLIERSDPTKLERLKRHFDDMLEAAEANEVDDFWAADADFHAVIHEASGNDRLVRYLRDLRDLTQLRPAVTRALLRNGIRPVAEAHWTIYEAIEAGEPEGARKAMENHIVETARIVRAAP